MTLKDLPAGKAAYITAVGGEGALRQHFLDMGVIPGSEIVLVKYAPMGDPIEFMIHGYELTLPYGIYLVRTAQHPAAVRIIAR